MKEKIYCSVGEGRNLLFNINDDEKAIIEVDGNTIKFSSPISEGEYIEVLKSRKLQKYPWLT